MKGLEVGLCVVEVVEAFVFVSDAFDLETALVPRIKDATCAPFPDCVAKVASSPWWSGVAMIGIGVGVGVGGGVVVVWVGGGSVRIGLWRVVKELRDEKLVVGGVLSEVVELLCEMFCELCVQDSQQEMVWVGGVEVVLCESC